MSGTERLPKGIMGERRRSNRLAVGVGCQAVTDEDDDFFLLSDEIVDISTDGVLVRAQGIPALVGERVIVSFRPPNSSVWIDAAGRIVRLLNGTEPGAPGFGIELLDLNPFDRALLETTIERCSERAGKSARVARRRHRFRVRRMGLVERSTRPARSPSPRPETLRSIIVIE